MLGLLSSMFFVFGIVKLGELAFVEFESVEIEEMKWIKWITWGALTGLSGVIMCYASLMKPEEIAPWSRGDVRTPILMQPTGMQLERAF